MTRRIDLKKLSLRERAALFFDLTETPGWKLLQQYFSTEIRTRITNTETKEQFIYDSIRGQVLQELFSLPLCVMRQAEQAWKGQAISQVSLLEKCEDDCSPKNDEQKDIG